LKPGSANTQNKTNQNKTKQNKTKQNKTKQNKTKQNKTKQNKTKQNKTYRCCGGTPPSFGARRPSCAFAPVSNNVPFLTGVPLRSLSSDPSAVPTSSPVAGVRKIPIVKSKAISDPVIICFWHVRIWHRGPRMSSRGDSRSKKMVDLGILGRQVPRVYRNTLDTLELDSHHVLVLGVHQLKLQHLIPLSKGGRTSHGKQRVTTKKMLL
jgi:hypothetical protein